MSKPKRDDTAAGSHRWRRLRAQVLAGATHCALCGGPLDFNAAPRTSAYPTVDHIIPRSAAPGLGLVLSNLRPAHWGCNSSRQGAGLVEKVTTREW